MSSPNILYGLTFSTKRSMDKYSLKFSNKIDSLERKNTKDGYNTRKCVYENYDKLFLKKTIVVDGYNTRKEVYSEYENYFDDLEKMVLYYDNENGTVKYSQKKLRLDNINLLDEIQKKNKSCLYQNYISFENDYTQKNIIKKYSVDELYKKISPHIDEYLLKNNFNLNNIKYFITFHTNTKNLHFHFDFIEKEPTREKNKLDKKYFKDLRKNIMLDLDKDLAKEYYKHNEDKLNLKNKIREQMKSIDFNKLDNLFKMGNQYYQEDKVRYYKDIKHKKFKNIIEEIKKESIRLNPQFEEQYKEFEESLKKDTKYYSKLYGETKNISHTNKQLEEIDLRLNNLILRQIKEYKEESNIKHKQLRKVNKTYKNKKINILKNLKQHKKEIEKLTKEHEQDLLYGY
ncbi:relaxase MobL [Mycobacterium sp.]|uniref:relaxase MobL n=1 Tax=Mycobacterium sp. TaxID=1785 RepID=UPI003A865F26